MTISVAPNASNITNVKNDATSLQETKAPYLPDEYRNSTSERLLNDLKSSTGVDIAADVAKNIPREVIEGTAFYNQQEYSSLWKVGTTRIGEKLTDWTDSAKGLLGPTRISIETAKTLENKYREQINASVDSLIEKTSDPEKQAQLKNLQTVINKTDKTANEYYNLLTGDKDYTNLLTGLKLNESWDHFNAVPGKSNEDHVKFAIAGAKYGNDRIQKLQASNAKLESAVGTVQSYQKEANNFDNVLKEIAIMRDYNRDIQDAPTFIQNVFKFAGADVTQKAYFPSAILPPAIK